MKYLRLLLLTFLSLLALNYTLHAKVGDIDIRRGEEHIDIEADELTYERESQTYHAHGKVEVKHGDLYLRADHARLNMATKDLEIWGNVLMREGEDVLECERMEVNINTKLGKVYNARLFLKDQNFHISGKEAEKLGENIYKVREGSFTTCDAERPPWKFTVKELEVTLEGYGIAKGPTFYLNGIPTLYLPMAIFPLKKERQTGFLIPRPGYSKRYGPELRNAFFWAISKDMDATFYFDRLGDHRGRGFKEGLEYRYAPTEDTRGEANFYFIDDQVYNGNRYAFFWRHEQRFPYSFYLKGNINHVSDNQYPRDFDEDIPGLAKSVDSWSRGQLRSNLYGGKNWDKFSLLAEAAVFNDLTKTSNDETVQKLPQISFNAHPQSLFKTPIFYEGSTSYSNFWREKGVGAHRWDILPRISYPLRLFNVIKINSDIAGRETFYYSYNDPLRRFKGEKSREIFDGGISVSTEFYRVYPSEVVAKVSNLYNVSKWMHTIEPYIDYRYSSPVNQRDIPVFDDVDRIPYFSQITYGVTQRLVGKPIKEGTTSGPYEYAKLRLSQSYSLGDPFERDSKGKGRYFSNFKGELWWNFGPYVSSQFDAEYSPYRGEFDGLNGLLNIRDKRNDAIQLQYRYTRDVIEELNVDTRIRIINPLYLYGGVRYNILEKWRVENIYGAEYQAQCWVLGFTIEDKNRSPDGTQKKDIKFSIYFNLLGIGSVGRVPYFMSF